MARNDPAGPPSHGSEGATPDPSAPLTAGRYAYERLERTFHEKARLGILTSLMTHPAGLAFNDLKELCALTDGNLSRHLQVLQEEGLVELGKSSNRRRPQTLVTLTEPGRRRFLEYIAELGQVVADALATRPSAGPVRSEGWSPA